MFGGYHSQHDPLGLKQQQPYITVQPASIELVNSTNGSSSRHPSTGRQANIGDADFTKNRKRKVSSTLNIKEGHVDKRVRLPSNNVLSKEQNDNSVDTRITPVPQNIDWSTLSFEDALPLVLKSMEPPESYDDILRELDEDIAKSKAPSSIPKSPSRWDAQPPTPLSMNASPGAWVPDDDHFLGQYTSQVPFNHEPNGIPTESYQIMDFAPSQQSPPLAEPRGPNGWTNDMDNLFQAAHHEVSKPTREMRPHPSNPELFGQRPHLSTPLQDVQFHRQYDLIAPPRYTHHGLPAPPTVQYHQPNIGLPGPPPSRIAQHSQQQHHPSDAHPLPSQATDPHQQHTHFHSSQAATGPQASSSSASTTAPLPSSVRYTDVPMKISGSNRPRAQLLLQYPKFSNQFKDRFVLREINITPQQQSLPRPCPLGAHCTAQVKISRLSDHIAHFHSDQGVLTCHGHPRKKKEFTKVAAMARHVLQEHWCVAQFECAYCGIRTKNVQGEMVDHWMNCDQLISLHANYRIQ